MRDAEPTNLGTVGGNIDDAEAEDASFDFELGWSGATGSQAILHRLSPPELPERLGPCQAAQLSELLEYPDVPIRTLLESVKIDEKKERITVKSGSGRICSTCSALGHVPAFDRPSARRRVATGCPPRALVC